MDFLIKTAIFILGLAAIIWVSRFSIRYKRPRGVYRAFSWIMILGLIMENGDYWFINRYSPQQIISWILLFISLGLVIKGFQLLLGLGKHDNNRDDRSLLGFEKTTALVTVGLYRHIRHPLYGSLLFLTWGIFFKHPSWLAGLLAVVSSFCLFKTARIEEIENIDYFGADYEEYMRRSKMFFPIVF